MSSIASQKQRKTKGRGNRDTTRINITKKKKQTISHSFISWVIDELEKLSGMNKMDFKYEPKISLLTSYKETNTEPN